MYVYPHIKRKSLVFIGIRTFRTKDAEQSDIQDLRPLYFFREPDSVVGIATGYGLDGPGIESRWGRRDFPHLSRPALGPTQLPVQWVPGLSRGLKRGRGVTLTPQPLLMPWSRKSRAIPLLLLWAVRPVQSLSVCTRVHFTFFYTLFLLPIAQLYRATSAAAYSYELAENAISLLLSRQLTSTPCLSS